VRVAVFEFGSFRLDSATRSLFRNGNLQTLAPKTFDVLLYLVERRTRVVSKNELLEAL
jgi:DNA-binding winged helix-turn-helix (wHTH) protein